MKHGHGDAGSGYHHQSPPVAVSRELKLPITMFNVYCFGLSVTIFLKLKLAYVKSSFFDSTHIKHGTLTSVLVVGVRQ